MYKYLLFLLIAVQIFSCDTSIKNTSLRGKVFGTTYSIIYDSEINYSKAVDSIFELINASMSTYQSNSLISKINRDETVKTDAHFRAVFNMAKTVFTTTNGAFDPTVGILVNAWDFGPDGQIKNLDSAKVKDLHASVGFDKLRISGDSLIKSKPDIYLDFNAIAKGYAVDKIAEFLEAQTITNYLVEIGGEIRVNGINAEKQTPWRIGIDRPNFEGNQSIYTSFNFSEGAMATSGTYRKFKVDSLGKRYTHIINTKTGFPIRTSILSVSVIASNCAIADAYATAFQAMTIEEITTVLEQQPELKVYLIFENENNELEACSLNGFPEK